MLLQYLTRVLAKFDRGSVELATSWYVYMSPSSEIDTVFFIKKREIDTVYEAYLAIAGRLTCD